MSSEVSVRSRAAFLACLAVVVAGVIAAIVLVHRGPAVQAVRLVPRVVHGDPLAFEAGQSASLEQAAASGLSQVLYAKSPGGVIAAAARTARYRPLIDRESAGSGIDPSVVEAIVLLESGGRPDVIAGADPAGAAGLTQILAQTGSDFLGMHVDLAKSRRLTRRIGAARRAGEKSATERLEARRRAIDARFVPAEAVAGTVRYLSFALARFGRQDLAVASYHMGIGNLEGVLRAYAGATGDVPIGAVVGERDLSYARVYFDSSPVRHRAAWLELNGFGDDSQTYYWRVLAAQEIMRLYRDDRGRLFELAALHGHGASAERVLHPPALTEQFASPHDVARAERTGLLQALPNDPRRLHFRIDPHLGALAPQLGQDPALYRALRPEALALLVYLAARVHAASGAETPLVVASAVRDDAYQQLVTAGTGRPAYSLATTGYAFDVRRRYGSGAQAGAFQYELERLQARDLIAWVRRPTVIHITVSSEARALVHEMLARASGSR